AAIEDATIPGWLEGETDADERTVPVGGEGGRLDEGEGEAGPEAEARDDGEAAAPDREAEGVTERTGAGEQGVIPGAEKVSDAALAGERAAEPLRPKADQRPMDEGLFGDSAGQADLVDMARTPPAREDAEGERKKRVAEHEAQQERRAALVENGL